jgi:hypothetical protein
MVCSICKYTGHNKKSCIKKHIKVDSGINLKLDFNDNNEKKIIEADSGMSPVIPSTLATISLPKLPPTCLEHSRIGLDQNGSVNEKKVTKLILKNSSIKTETDTGMIPVVPLALVTNLEEKLLLNSAEYSEISLDENKLKSEITKHQFKSDTLPTSTIISINKIIALLEPVYKILENKHKSKTYPDIFFRYNCNKI